MAKLISVPQEVYDSLKNLRVGDESFGSAIRRLIQKGDANAENGILRT